MGHHEKKQPTTALLTLEALCGEIERLRRVKEEGGELSRSNKRLLKSYKLQLRKRLGAAVIYPEDRMTVPSPEHMQLVFELGKANTRLKQHLGETYDGKLIHLMLDIFRFEVSPRTIFRYYYMSDDDKETGK